jgi:hypothetical protein
VLCEGIEKRDRYPGGEFPCMVSLKFQGDYHANEWEAGRIKVVVSRVLVRSRGSLLRERRGDPCQSPTPVCCWDGDDHGAEEL